MKRFVEMRGKGKDGKKLDSEAKVEREFSLVGGTKRFDKGKG